MVGRVRTTVLKYLAAYILRNGIRDASPWVNPEIFDAVRDAYLRHGGDRLRPIFEHLNGKVPYDQIRVCIACIMNQDQVQDKGHKPDEVVI